jgi:hypothetical protein
LEKHEYKKALGFLNRRVKLARSILGRTYSMHPLRNAFDGVPFGAKKHGILVATTEDHLHACESGIMLNHAEVAYGGLIPAESKVFEQIIQSKVTACQSSVLSELPCGTTKKNFGNLTLCSHKEKVGSIYYLLLALHDEGGCSMSEQAQTRQKTRYSKFLTRKRIKEWQDVKNKGKASKRRKTTNEVGALFCVLADTQGNHDKEEELGEAAFQNMKDDKKEEEEEEIPQSAFSYHKDLLFGMDHNDKVPFDHKDKSIEFIFANLNHHGFGFLLHEDLDEIQLNLLMITSWSILQPHHGKMDQFPNKETFNVLSNHQDTQAMFVSVLPSEDGGEIDKPTFLEATCKL